MSVATDACPDELRKVIKFGMLGSNLNFRYYDYLAQEYNKRDERIRISLTILTVITTESVAVRVLTDLHVLDAVVFILALATAVLASYGLETKIKLVTDLANSYNRIADKFELLWNNIMLKIPGDYKSEYIKILKEDQQIKNEPRIPMDKRLIDELKQETINNLRSKGYLPKPSGKPPAEKDHGNS